MPEAKGILQPLFAGPESMIWPEEQYFKAYPCVLSYLDKFKELDASKDFCGVRRYLSLHNQSQGTYGNYRGFTERLLLWSWIYAQKSALILTRKDIAEFLAFNKNPSSDWVCNAPKPRFINDNGNWRSNPDWRPIINVRSVHSAAYQPHNGAMRQLLSICSSFYNFLHREGLAAANPIVGASPQQGRAFNRGQPPRNVISSQLIELIIRRLEQQALDSPDGERALFIITAALYLYLRSSDLACGDDIYPTMNSFIFDDGNWWFIHSTHNPPHRSPVSSVFLQYLIRYRTSRGLSQLPELNEEVPLLETVHGRGGLSSRRIKETVKASLNEVHRSLLAEGYDEANLEVIKSLSLRWFRDSGAKLDALNRSPADLGKDLGNISPAYAYGRYYVG